MTIEKMGNGFTVFYQGDEIFFSTEEEAKKFIEDQEEETMEEKIRSIFEEMDDAEIVSIWNEYCYDCNLYDDEILDYERMEELIQNSNEDGMYWINRFFYGSDDYSTEGSANPNRDYFTFNGYGNVISFDYIYNSYTNEFNHIDIDDLIDHMIENKESFGNDEIEELFEEEEEAA